MRILLSAVGTRGDVQPVIALALSIRKLGHHARLCIPPNFVDWATGLGLEAVPVGVEMRAHRAGHPPAAPIHDLITDQFDVLGAAAKGCDLILAGGAHQYAARSAAEVESIPYIVAVYAPVSLPSVDLAPPGHAEPPQEPADIAQLWREYKMSWNARALERVNANRKRWKLAPVDDVIEYILAHQPWLAADSLLAPPPTTPDMQVISRGAWILADEAPLSPELESFLSAGDPPIYFGFGSMPIAKDIAFSLVSAARALGKRAIVSRGWADLTLKETAPDFLVIDDVNQQALFPRVAAVVHHGGAGTTAAAARAGVPQVAAAMFSDQFYWGRRLESLSIGASLAMSAFSQDALVKALSRALAVDIAHGAQAVGKKMSMTAACADIAARRLIAN